MPTQREQADKFHNSAHRSSARLASLLGVMHERKTSTQTESGWSLRLKQVSEAAVRELSVQVISARLAHVYDPTDRDVALFHLETNEGRIKAALSRTGEYSFYREQQ